MKGQPSNSELSEALKLLSLPHTGTKQVLLDRLAWAELTQYTEIFKHIQETSKTWDLNFSTLGPTIKRIPKASRIQACKTLTDVLTQVISVNDKNSWEKLLQYPRFCLGGTARGGKNKKSQATLVNNKIDSFIKGAYSFHQQSLESIKTNIKLWE